MSGDFELIAECAAADAEALEEAEKKYGESWCKRGGVGAFMMLARKWDRIENICEYKNYDVLQILEDEDLNPTGLIDDIRDLRRYLLLVEGKAIQQKEARDEEEARTAMAAHPE